MTKSVIFNFPKLTLILLLHLFAKNVGEEKLQMIVNYIIKIMHARSAEVQCTRFYFHGREADFPGMDAYMVLNGREFNVLQLSHLYIFSQWKNRPEVY